MNTGCFQICACVGHPRIIRRERDWSLRHQRNALAGDVSILRSYRRVWPEKNWPEFFTGILLVLRRYASEHRFGWSYARADYFEASIVRRKMHAVMLEHLAKQCGWAPLVSWIVSVST